MSPDERFGEAVAPNGRPVVENFQRWFKDSQVVDAAGDPLVVYHGTLNVFPEFKLGHGEGQSRGFMFVEQDNVNAYLWGYMDQVKYQQEERPGDMAVMPMFLSIQNPLRVNTTETGAWADPESENATIAEAKCLGHDGVVFTTSPQVASDFAGEGASVCVMPVFLRLANPYRMTAGEWALLQDYEGPKAVRLFKAEKEALGHDGLVNFSGTQFVAFRADQVKSATGNSGLFLNGPKISDKPGDVEAAALRARLLVELENGQRSSVKRLARA